MPKPTLFSIAFVLISFNLLLLECSNATEEEGPYLKSFATDSFGVEHEGFIISASGHRVRRSRNFRKEPRQRYGKFALRGVDMTTGKGIELDNITPPPKGENMDDMGPTPLTFDQQRGLGVDQVKLYKKGSARVYLGVQYGELPLEKGKFNPFRRSVLVKKKGEKVEVRGIVKA